MSSVKKYIGTSLSFCIQDILKGNIEIDEISAIVTSTAFSSIEEAYSAYGKTYWSKWGTERVYNILDEVWPLVFQPRLRNMFEHRGHYAGKGWWLNTMTGEYLKVPEKQD